MSISPNNTEENFSEDELEALENCKSATAGIRTELATVIIGQREVIDQLNDEYRQDPAMQSAIAAVELAERALERRQLRVELHAVSAERDSQVRP